ncbi:S24/S26 family peptidase [Nocardia jiangsuensis]|uniref:S24/S26 family peptidase n=1 Tax=Nocardia jiangsuensis TaxID=1691563 RepID=A0ABV8DZE2_9NOCA
MRTPAQIALTAGAVAGTICLIAAAAALLFGIKPLLFRSGSMEPEIGPGAVALVRTIDAAEIDPGDVVSVRNAAGERLTHRVVAVDAVTGNSATIRLKGDANESEDAQPYTVTEAERVFLHVEKLGYAVAWLASPPAVFLGGAFAGLLLAIAFLPRPPRTAPGGGGKRAAAPLVVVAALVTATGPAGAPEAQAAATDAAAANSGAFTSRTEFVPRINQPFSTGSYVTCSKTPATGPDPVTMRWRHIGAPYLYRLVLRDLGGTIWRTWDVTTVPAAAGDTVSFVITGAGLPARLALPYLYDLEVHTVLPGPPVSSGAVSTAWRGYGVQQVLLIGLITPEDLDCGVLRTEQNGTPAYVPGPASVSCADAAPRVTLTWPHLGSPYTYTLIVRDGTSRNSMLTRQNIAGPAQAGQNVTSTIAVADLDLGQRTGNAAVAEIRATNGSAVSSEFAQQNLTVTTTSVACPAAGLRAQSAPSSSTTATTTGSTTPTTSAPTTSPTPGTAPPPAPATTTTTPAPVPGPPAPAPATTTTTTPPPEARELPPTTTPSSTPTTPP